MSMPSDAHVAINVGEVFLDQRVGLVADVEIHAVRAEAFHFVVDGARDDVARREFGARVELRHEAFAVGQQQQAAFAAHRFGDQERFRVRVKQAGRMELIELHVRDATAGAPRHRDAVAGRAVRIAGIEVHLARAAGCENHARRLEHFDVIGLLVVDVGADAAIRRAAELGGGDQVDGDVIREQSRCWPRRVPHVSGSTRPRARLRRPRAAPDGTNDHLPGSDGSRCRRGRTQLPSESVEQWLRAHDTPRARRFSRGTDPRPRAACPARVRIRCPQDR